MATSPLVTNEAIKLIIKIPVPNCAELASQKLVTCEGNLVSGVYDLVGFLNVIFQFVIIAGITVVVFMAILEGFKILFYSPVASKIKDAKSNLTKLATTLIILMFSVVILNQINPDLINGKLNIESVTRIELCSDITDQAICKANTENCIWSDKCYNIDEAPCAGFFDEDICPTQRCSWTSNKCVAINATTEIGCYALHELAVERNDKSRCESNPGCSVVYGCYPKDASKIKYVNGQLPNIPEMNCYKNKFVQTCPTDVCKFIQPGSSDFACLSDAQIAEREGSTATTGTIQNGQPCTQDLTCQSGLCNLIDSYNKCSPKGPIGANCLSNNYCASSSCDSATKKCIGKTAGQSCNNNAECQAPLICDLSGGILKCVSPSTSSGSGEL